MISFFVFRPIHTYSVSKKTGCGAATYKRIGTHTRAGFFFMLRFVLPLEVRYKQAMPRRGHFSSFFRRPADCVFCRKTCAPAGAALRPDASLRTGVTLIQGDGHHPGLHGYYPRRSALDADADGSSGSQIHMVRFRWAPVM